MEELRKLRGVAAARSLFEAGTLQRAVDRLGFVQADPIRSPARAQDLILRHRVAGYRAGDLERLYPRLDAEEDYLYAYGFVSRGVWRLLHPRGGGKPGAFEGKVLAAVTGLGEAHPGELEKHLGARRVTNAWGGLSKATTQALDWLHYRGLLRVARREGGVRVFAPARQAPDPLPARQRMRERVLALVNILAPVPLRQLRAMAARPLSRYFPGLGTAPAFLASMIKEGELAVVKAGGADYVLPPGCDLSAEAPRKVRFLAPFDPLVWDRARFEHFWGWAYRFEAYTPAAKRLRGYYAMPLLWGDEVIGWANAAVTEGSLRVETGFARPRPAGAAFRRELDAEQARLAAFLGARL
ncbi:MAG: crosslink repair DNA glycosylase YcaQ family protein [Elusimicrobiales bacterium]|nr:crosslink repair DNA glycosylase YcaQ family protein [Elusimicrobiales bacterium]